MRRGLLLVLAGIALAFPGAAQGDVRVLATTVTPARPYVGDVVECSVTFEPGGARIEEGSFDTAPPEGKVPDTELVSASVRKKAGTWVYSVRFIAWVPGSTRIPVPSSAGFALPETRVEIASVVDDFGRSPPRYKDPMVLPGTRLLVWGAAGGLLLGAVLAWSTAFGLVPWLRRLRRAWREGRAGRDFGHALDYLESAQADLRTEELWALLAKALREYLSIRTRVPYRSYTASEARSAFPDGLPEGVAQETAALLDEGEAVRFAREDSGVEGIPRAIARCRGILRSIEEAARDILR